jgi:hypothetical protein
MTESITGMSFAKGLQKEIFGPRIWQNCLPKIIADSNSGAHENVQLKQRETVSAQPTCFLVMGFGKKTGF